MSTEKINDILTKIKSEKIVRVHFQFVDILGNLKSVGVPTETSDNITDFKEHLEEGLGFDGSSVLGFVRIAESDLVLKPNINTFKVFPWKVENFSEGRLICNVLKPSGLPFEGDPIHLLKTAEDRLEEKLGKGMKFNVAPEIEFFLFEMDGEMTTKQIKTDVYGYFDYSPLYKSSIALNKAQRYMQDLGLILYKDHHEVANSQWEINFKYDVAFETAINFIYYKLSLKTAALENNLYASFMPKPIFGVAGSGSHTHQSIFNGDGENIFFDPNDDYNLSDIAKHFLAGQLKYVREITAVTNPTVNSYKRLTPGYEAPVYICWGRRNRSALVRVPVYFPGKEKATRLEGRWPDPSMNPFLGFAVMLEAGLQGIMDKEDLTDAVEEDVYHFDDEKLMKFYIKTLPGSLGEAIELMKNSENDIARKAIGDFTFEKLVDALKAQWDEYRIRVHDWELDKYLSL